MKKSELQTGMWVEVRSGKIFLVLKGEMGTHYHGTQSLVFIRKNGYDVGDDYNEDLTVKVGTGSCDIIKVYENKYGNIINADTYTFDKKCYKCIWERKEKVPFKLNDYKGKYVMRCDTEEKADEFCKFLHSKGRKWNSGKSYFDTNRWTSLREDVYYFNEGARSSKESAEEYNYIVLNFDDFSFKIPKYKDVTKETTQGTVIEVSNDNRSWYERKFVAFVDGTIVAETPNVAKVKTFKYGRLQIDEKGETK